MSKFTNTLYTDTTKNLTQAIGEKAKNPFYKFSDKQPTEVIYWKLNRERTTLDEATSDDYESLGEASPLRFNQINGFYIYGFERITLDYDLTDFGLEANEIAGEAIILPGTIHPLPGDVFKVPIIKEDVLFKVNKVTPDTLDSGANSYKIEYKLEYINKYEQIQKQTVRVYTFVIGNVGTDYNCFIKDEESGLIAEMEKILEIMTDAYQLFFDPGTQTYVYQENGDYFYDPFLIEFLIRTKILSYAKDYIFVHHATAVYNTFAYDYNRCFFAMMEDPSIFDAKKASKMASGLLIEDPNSLFVTRLPDYFKIDYRDQFQHITKFWTIDPSLIDKLSTGEYFSEDSPMAKYNLIIAYFSGDTDNVTTDMIRALRTMDYPRDKATFYFIPLAMYVMVKYMEALLRDTSATTLSL